MAFKFVVKKPADAVGPEVLPEAARVPYLKRNDNDDTPDYWWDGIEWQPHPALPEGDVTTWGREQLKQVLRLMGAKEDEVNGQPIAELRKLHAKKAV